MTASVAVTASQGFGALAGRGAAAAAAAGSARPVARSDDATNSLVVSRGRGSSTSTAAAAAAAAAGPPLATAPAAIPIELHVASAGRTGHAQLEHMANGRESNGSVTASTRVEEEPLVVQFKAFWATVTDANWARFNQHARARALAQKWFRRALEEMLDKALIDIPAYETIGDLTGALYDGVEHARHCQLRVPIGHSTWDVTYGSSTPYGRSHMGH